MLYLFAILVTSPWPESIIEDRRIKDWLILTCDDKEICLLFVGEDTETST